MVDGGRAAGRVRATLIAVATLLVVAFPSGATAATRSLSPGGSDAGACLSAPCRTLDYAYRQAQPGDVVALAGGTYPAQDINPIVGRGGPAIEFRPAGGSDVTISNLDVGASNLTLRSLRIGNILDVTGQQAPVTGVSLVDVSGPQLYVQNVRGFTATGGGWGPRTDKQPVIVGSSPESYDVSFDGVDFHDALVTNASVHTECALILNVQRLTIRNSIFRNCTYFGLMLADLYGTLDPSDTTLENNVFEATVQSDGRPAPYSMIVGPIQASNFVLRNNTFETEPAFNGTVFSGSRFVGNIAPVGGCYPGLTYAYNLFSTRTCAPTDKRNAAALGQFNDPAGHDWRLKAGAAAIGAGSPSDHPATDRVGTPRGSVPAAGAHEPGAKSADPPPPGPGGESDDGTPPGPGPSGTGDGDATTAVTSTAAAGLLGAWSFDEPRGRTAKDASKARNPATIAHAVRTKGRYGRALAFNGRDTLVTVRGPLDLRRALTLEAWVKPARRNGMSRVFAGLRLRAALPLHRWAHLATTWDGSTLRVYVDGRELGSQPLQDPGMRALRIGGVSFKGAVDEVRVYDRALSAAQIRADRARPISKI